MEKMKWCLITSSDKQFWDDSNPLLFLDRGCCLLKQEEELKGKRYSFYQKKWNNNNEFKNTRIYLEDFYQRIKKALGEALNRYHKIDYDDKSWSILIGWWLKQYVAFLYYKYILLYEVNEKYDVYAVGLRYKTNPSFFSGEEFIDAVINIDEYNTYMSTRIMDYMNYDIVRYISSDFVCKEQKRKKSKLSLENVNFKILEWVTKDHKNILYDNALKLSMKPLIKLMYMGDMSYKTSENNINFLRKEYNDKIRENFDLKFDCKNVFESMVCAFLIMDIPTAYLENYETIRRKSIKYFGKKKGLFYTYQGWYNDEFSKSYIAFSRQKGMKLCGIQHGGTPIWCGSIDVFDLQCADIYYSWGWKRFSLSCEVRPFLSPKLSEELCYRVDKKVSNEILFCATCEPRYVYRFDLPHRLQMIEFIEEELFFFELMNKNSIPYRARLYNNDFGWNIKDRIMKKNIEIRIEEWDIPIWQSLQNCGLYICDIISTSWAEAFVMGVPILFVTDVKMEDYSEEALSDIDKLKECGIYYNSFEDVVDLLKKIYNDIPTWWNEVNRQKVINEFGRKYAYAGNLWTDDWIREVQKV